MPVRIRASIFFLLFCPLCIWLPIMGSPWPGKSLHPMLRAGSCCPIVFFCVFPVAGRGNLKVAIGGGRCFSMRCIILDGRAEMGSSSLAAARLMRPPWQAGLAGSHLSPASSKEHTENVPESQYPPKPVLQPLFGLCARPAWCHGAGQGGSGVSLGCGFPCCHNGFGVSLPLWDRSFKKREGTAIS